MRQGVVCSRVTSVFASDEAAGSATRFARCTQGSARSPFFCDDCPPGVDIAGISSSTVEMLATVRLIAQSRCNPVLIIGETGTGKELAAKALHAWRCDGQQRFVAVNCAALTANLLESELFGHVKGAFTGADREKTGLFELAGQGTLFLDEISEMPPELQAKLLRVLQERNFRKVGGTKDIACNATIIASSNRDLLSESQAGRFRKDLYYRLAVFPIVLEPLRSPRRRDDVLLLAEFLLENSTISDNPKPTGFTGPARQKLLTHNWPGNVRELRNVVDRAIILAGGRQVGPENILIECSPLGGWQESPKTTREQTSQVADRKDFSLETAERQFILRALKETGWQRARAAALLGITRSTLHAKLKRYDIQAPAAGRTEVLPDSSGPLRPQPVCV